MLNIDSLAHHSAMQKGAASQKLLLSLSALLFVTITRNNEIAIFSIVFMSCVLLFFAKIPWKSYFLLLMAPLGFSVAGIVTIILSISFHNSVPSHAIWSSTFSSISLFILPNDVVRGFTTFCVAFSATSCLYMLILTTPIYEISPVLIKCHVPLIIVELIELIYRFIFLFLQISVGIFTAQQARLGYKNTKTGFYSLCMLIVSMFKAIFVRYSTMSLAMQARNIEQFVIPQDYVTKKIWIPALNYLFFMYFAIGLLLLFIF